MAMKDELNIGRRSMLGRVNDVDIRLLRVFVKIVECGGFKPAQVALNISASQISGQMNDLETRLGYRLCERGRGGFRLTPQGDIIYNQAMDLLAHMDTFRTVAAEQTSRLSGNFRIGVIDCLITSPDFHMPEAINRFSQHENDVRISLETLPAADLQNRVLDGSLDLGVGFFYHQATGLEYERLFKEQHFLYCGATHPLFARSDEEISLEDIESESVLNRGFFEPEHIPIDGGPVWPNFKSPDAAYAVNPEATAIIVLSGFCLAFLPSHYARQFEEAGRIKPIWPDRIYQFGTCHLIRKSASAPTLAQQAFLDAIHAVYKEHI
jgi:DNA-binding transcriptional LysR family regulator